MQNLFHRKEICLDQNGKEGSVRSCLCYSSSFQKLSNIGFICHMSLKKEVQLSETTALIFPTLYIWYFPTSSERFSKSHRASEVFAIPLYPWLHFFFFWWICFLSFNELLIHEIMCAWSLANYYLWLFSDGSYWKPSGNPSTWTGLP